MTMKVSRKAKKLVRKKMTGGFQCLIATCLFVFFLSFRQLVLSYEAETLIHIISKISRFTQKNAMYPAKRVSKSRFWALPGEVHWSHQWDLAWDLGLTKFHFSLSWMSHGCRSTGIWFQRQIQS